MSLTIGLNVYWSLLRASWVAQTVKNLIAMQETPVRSLGWEDPWRRAWQPTAVFLPGESPGQRSLAGYSPWGGKDLLWIHQSYPQSIFFSHCLLHISFFMPSQHFPLCLSLIFFLLFNFMVSLPPIDCQVCQSFFEVF